MSRFSWPPTARAPAGSGSSLFLRQSTPVDALIVTVRSAVSPRLVRPHLIRSSSMPASVPIAHANLVAHQHRRGPRRRLDREHRHFLDRDHGRGLHRQPWRRVHEFIQPADRTRYEHSWFANGTATITLASDGTFNSGTVTALPSQTVNASAGLPSSSSQYAPSDDQSRHGSRRYGNEHGTLHFEYCGRHRRLHGKTRGFLCSVSASLAGVGQRIGPCLQTIRRATRWPYDSRPARPVLSAAQRR